MKTSDNAAVFTMYNDNAEAYGEMMNEEIQLPIYDKTLSTFAQHLRTIEGPVLDTSCGTGHLLELYRSKYDPLRALLGLDLSSAMINASRKRLGSDISLEQGDMRTLSSHRSSSLAGLISFFALHHLDEADVVSTFEEWRRVLVPGGQLLIGAWEGTGEIDYGENAQLVALLHRREDLANWLNTARFDCELVEQRFEQQMGMNSVYFRATALS